MYLLLLWLAKAVQAISRKRGHGGAALPGLIVEKFSKNFLKHYMDKIPGGVVIVSGTNGKTTTTKIIVEVLEGFNKKVFTNRTGSNMTRGLISAIISQSSIFGRLPYDIAVLEVDEAYAAVFSKKITVKGAVILNVMRDQLDRFGEIDTTAKLLEELSSSAQDFVVLNAHDPRVKDMKTYKNSKKVYFGLEAKLKKDFITDDEWHRLEKEQKTDKADYLLVNSIGGKCSLSANNQKFDLNTVITGVHNHLNVVAAIACIEQLRVASDLNEIIKIAEKVQPAFGRGEKITIGGSVFTLQLIKNPGSFMQNLKSIDLKKYDSSTIIINDAYADSRDVSWLWDVDFTAFSDVENINAGGSRAYDLAVRLKHSNLKPNLISTDISYLTDEMIKQGGEQLIFCTYTAMLNLRKIFVKKGHAEKVL